MCNINLKNFLRLIYKKHRILSNMIVVLVFLTLTLGMSFVSLLANFSEIINGYESLTREETQFVLKNEQVSAEKMREIKGKYAIDALDIHASKYVESRNQRTRVVKIPNEVNKLEVVSGRLPVGNDEVVMEDKIGRYHKHVLDDTITVADEVYKIVGFVEYPNLVAPNMSRSSFVLVNQAADLLVSFSAETYDALAAEEKQYYVAKGGNVAKIQADSSYYLLYKDNTELNSIDEQRTMLTMSLGIALGMMFSIIVILLFLVIAKTITDSMHEIGVMLAFGYKKSYILGNLSSAILTYFGVAFVALIASELLKETGFVFFTEHNLVHYQAINTWVMNLLFLCGILGSVFIIVYGYSMYILRKRTIISMITVSGKNKISKLTRRIFKLTGNSMKRKFVLSDLMVCFLLFFGGFAALVQMLFAFGMIQFTDKLADSVQDGHKYDYVYSIMPLDERQKQSFGERQQQYYVKSNILLSDNESLDLIMLDTTDDELLDLGADASSRDGVVINKWLANKYGLKKDDTVDVTSNEQKITLKIAMINETVFYGKEVYVFADYYKEHISTEVSYNGLYTDTVLTDQANVTVLFEMKKDNALAAVTENIILLQTTAIGMIVLGVLISSIVMTIGLDVLSRNNRKNIVLLKILGYTNGKIYQTVIVSQLVFVLIGTLIAMPYFGLIENILFREISKTGTLFYDFSVDGLVGVVLVVSVNSFFLLLSRYFFTSVVGRKNLGSLYTEE